MKKTVLITGATGDIGRAIVIKFAQEGWNIIAQYSSSMVKAEDLEKKFSAQGVHCIFLKANFLSEFEVKRLLSALKKYRIDTLVNNAGSYVEKKHFNEITLQNLNQTFMVNVFVPILLTSQIFEDMKQRGGGGRIVNISSIAAKYGGSPRSLHYGAAKRALEGMTRTLARAGASQNIYVNTIRAGIIDTNIQKIFPKDIEQRIGLIPLRRMGQTQDIADMTFYLGSDKNNYITNETMTIAGGE